MRAAEAGLRPSSPEDRSATPVPAPSPAASSASSTRPAPTLASASVPAPASRTVAWPATPASVVAAQAVSAASTPTAPPFGMGGSETVGAAPTLPVSGKDGSVPGDGGFTRDGGEGSGSEGRREAASGALQAGSGGTVGSAGTGDRTVTSGGGAGSQPVAAGSGRAEPMESPAFLGSSTTGTGNGTVSADSDGSMRRGRNLDKSAERGVQKLPGATEAMPGMASVGAASPSGSQSPALGVGVRESGSRRMSALGGSGESWGEMVGSGMEGSTATAVRGQAEAVRGQGEVAEVPGASMEERVRRLEALVSREVVRFRWNGLETVSVLIRPDERTEVTVHLRQRDGQLEASLGMDRGDAARFGAHWRQLQDALAEQNVRLLPARDWAAASPAGSGMNTTSTATQSSASAAAAGSGTGAGQGQGSGQGSGWNPPSGGQSWAGGDWRDGAGGAGGAGSGGQDQASGRRRGIDWGAGEDEGPRHRVASTLVRGGRTSGMARPEGWEFWA